MSSPAGAHTRLYLVRHGRVHNPHEVAYGHLPRYRLDETGWSQAQRAAAWLADAGLAAVFSSPLLRARQTASAIRERAGNPPLHLSRDLRESELGRYWQGLRWSEIEAEQAELYALFRERPSQITAGETLAAMAARMAAACRRAARRYPGRTLALVSHRDPILSLRLATEEGRHHDELNRTDCATGSITEFRVEGGVLAFVRYLEP
jgi:broad specificity phosphatase PhoE